MNLKPYDTVFLIGLLLLAVLIWARDLAWITTAEDTLPILVALPLFYWLGKPWTFLDKEPVFSNQLFFFSIFLFLVGFAASQSVLLSVAWTLLLWTWLQARIPEEDKSRVKKLLVLPVLAFPWIALDADRIGWWFRLSAASLTSKAFEVAGFPVHQEGTNMIINKLPISVEVACAGLNTLQAMLIAGTVILFLILGKTNRYWWNIPLLIAMAWFTNTIRIMFLVIIALVISPEFAMSAFHTWGGWFVIILMFLLCWFIFTLQEPKNKDPSET